MVIPAIIGIIILVVIVYVALKILKNLLLAFVLISLVFIASLLIFGSLPDMRTIPIIGQFIPKLPSTTGEVIAVIKNVFYSIDILATSRDSQNDLLITVVNTGKLEVSDFKVFVDGQTVKIINNPDDPLKSGKTTVFQTDWSKDFSYVFVQAKQTNATFSKE
jgi:energy-coupling factor transporter transmembrane protein EcfT